jgi:hypothetical protein
VVDHHRIDLLAVAIGICAVSRQCDIAASQMSFEEIVHEGPAILSRAHGFASCCLLECLELRHNREVPIGAREKRSPAGEQPV